MTELVRLLLMVALAGSGLSAIVLVWLWWLAEPRRIQRALTRVLGGPPEAVLVGHGQGRGAGFSFRTGSLAVAWDGGAWCLVYRLDELIGAEVIVDGAIMARAFRGEARRPLDRIPDAIDDASLRLIFDDAQYPDFEIRLWPGAGHRAGAPGDPRAAISEANRWLARVEAILRLPLATVVTKPTAPMAPLFQTYAAPPPQDHDDDGDDDGDEPLRRRLV